MKNLAYNKAGIMTFAHKMWTPKPTSFSEKLKYAWALAKNYMANGKVTGQFVIYKNNGNTISWEEGLRDYYQNAPRGTYFGD